MCVFPLVRWVHGYSTKRLVVLLCADVAGTKTHTSGVVNFLVWIGVFLRSWIAGAVASVRDYSRLQYMDARGSTKRLPREF